MKKFLIYTLIAFSFSSLMAQDIKVDYNTEGESFEHYWSKCVGAGRAAEGLRAGWLEQLEKVHQDCGFETVRFHGLFHDDMFVYFEKNGKVSYNWQYIDDLFDRMLDLNVRPFLELGFFPTAMAADSSQTVFWWKAAVTPKEESFGQFHDMIKAFTQHCVDRYGIDEVSTWYFEVWNEANLDFGFWDAGRADYFRLYKETVTAVKSVNADLMVGGPSTTNFVADNRYDADRQTHPDQVMWNRDNINDIQWKGVWIEEFLEFCAEEKLPVDFISCHPYPTDYALNPSTSRFEGLTRYAKSIIDDMNWVKKTLAASEFPDAEIHYTEWNTSPSSRDATHDFLTPAAYIVKSNLDCIGLCNSLAFWTFTDIFEEKGGGQSIFHGGFGMINYQGIVKPSYHAYRMLHALGDEKLFSNDYLFVSKKSGNGKIVALAYNYPDEYLDAVPGGHNKREKGTSKQLNLNISDLKEGSMFRVEILDKDNGNIHNYWESMGKPEPPTREQVVMMKQHAENLKTSFITVGKDGKLNIDHLITPWSLVLIEQVN